MQKPDRGFRSYLAAAGTTVAPFMGGMLISNIGRNAYYVGMTWIALTQTNSMQVVTLLLLVGTVMEFLSSSVSGYAADIMDRRRLSIALDIMRALILIVTGLLEMTGAGIWLLFVSIALYSIVDRGYLTTMQSMIPVLAPGKSSVKINSASYLMMQSGNFLGALLTGWLLHNFPDGAALAIIGAAFGISALLTADIRIGMPDPVAKPDSHVLALRQAFSIRHLAENNLIMAAICWSAVFAVGILINVLLAGYVLKEMQGNAVLFGQMESGWAFGSVLACWTLAIGIGATLVRPTLLPLLFLSGLGLIVLWLVQYPTMTVAALICLGALYNLCRVIVDVQIQQTVALNAVGRTKGSIQTISTGFGLAIYALIAFIADIVPASAIFAVYGGFAILVSGALALVSGSRRRRTDIERSRQL